MMFYRVLIFAILLLCTAPVWSTKLVTAKSWLVADGDGRVLSGDNVDAIRSIASITKLMTVMTVLDSGASLSETLTTKFNGRTVNRQQLIDLAMIRSDNGAAKMLCDTYPGGYIRCLIDMNRKATSLGMNHTMFTDPTGLYNTNVSTANDLLKLVLAAVNYPQIVAASNAPTVEVPGSKKGWLSRNTNPIIGRGLEFIVSKTGYIRDAGGCIVMMLNTVNGVRAVILLGSQNTKTRAPEAQALSEKY